MATAVKAFTMRLPREDYEKLRILAKRHKRSMAAELELVLEQHFEKYEERNGKIAGNITTSNQIGNNLIAF